MDDDDELDSFLGEMMPDWIDGDADIY